MKRKIRISVLLVICLLASALLSSCDSSYADMGYVSGDRNYNEGSSKAMNDYVKGEPGSGELSATVVETNRKIVYSSWATIQTKTYDESVDAVKDLCEKYNAYFQSSTTYGNGIDSRDSRSANYTIRIPVENYSDFVKEIGGIGSVFESGEDNQDVTEQYVDIEARLSSAKLREERVLVLLENADKLDDVLALERELSDIRYEIESYTGSLRKLNSLIDYATFTLRLVEVVEYTAPVVVSESFGERLAAAFSEGLDYFVSFWQGTLILLTFLAPTLVLLLVVCVIIIIVVFIRKRKKKRNANIDKNKNCK